MVVVCIGSSSLAVWPWVGGWQRVDPNSSSRQQLQQVVVAAARHRVYHPADDKRDKHRLHTERTEQQDSLCQWILAFVLCLPATSSWQALQP